MNTEIEVTDWFPHDVNPVHAGDYEVLFSNFNSSMMLSRFGNGWLNSMLDPIFLLPGDQWRGVKRAIDPIDEFLS